MDTPKPIWTIYCHTHIDTGRRYIGLTKLTMMQRWNQHIANAKSKQGVGCWHFWSAIRKYGRDSFSHEALCQSSTLENANIVEEKLILQYDTRDSEKGFNLAKGGAHTPSHSKVNPWDDPSFRGRVSSSVKKAFATPQSKALRKRISKDLWSNLQFRDKITGALAQSQSEPEIRAKISAGMRKRYEDPAQRAESSLRWKDPEYRAKCSVGLTNGKNKNKTHCSNGHEYTEENTYIYGKNIRRCRTCIRERRNPAVV